MSYPHAVFDFDQSPMPHQTSRERCFRTQDAQRIAGNIPSRGGRKLDGPLISWRYLGSALDYVQLVRPFDSLLLRFHLSGSRAYERHLLGSLAG